MDAATIAAIIGAGGLTVLVPQVISGVRGWRDGAHQREKAAAVDALTQRDDAIRDRDRADRCRRIITEHAAEVRRIAIEHGLGPLLPPWPARTTRPEETP